MKSGDHLKQVESKAEYALRHILLYFQYALRNHLLGYRRFFLWYMSYVYDCINLNYFLQRRDELNVLKGASIREKVNRMINEKILFSTPCKFVGISKYFDNEFNSDTGADLDQY